MTAVDPVLTEPERHRLADLEETIGHGLQTFVEVGTALAEVRDSRLYRAEWDTFENYCDARWGLERSSAYRLIEAASVVSAIADTGASVLPSNVAQTRELAARARAVRSVGQGQRGNRREADRGGRRGSRARGGSPQKLHPQSTDPSTPLSQSSPVCPHLQVS